MNSKVVEMYCNKCKNIWDRDLPVKSEPCDHCGSNLIEAFRFDYIKKLRAIKKTQDGKKITVDHMADSLNIEKEEYLQLEVGCYRPSRRMLIVLSTILEIPVSVMFRNSQ